MLILNSFPAAKIATRSVTSSTLLIPMHLMDYFQDRVRDFQGIGRYFEYLIITYGRQLTLYNIDPTNRQWKQKYQDQGLDLQVRNFKPNPELWEEFRHIGFAYGLAMCHLFVVLLELEYSRWQQATSPAVFHETPPAKVKSPKERCELNKKPAQSGL
ncbi:MAG: DUF1564 family protein [Leptospiraceae bacterium]|nr:DUF1564 family protein [Leptospiraceae bacterium]